VLVSSHLLSEIARTVDDVVIIAHGRLVAHSPVADLAPTEPTGFGVRLRTADAAAAMAALAAAQLDVRGDGSGALVVCGASPEAVGRAIAAAGLTVFEMRTIDPSLEDVFMELTK
jgi:ABC-2 type transport system ATP-binding protein